jgi:hypothetical protein
MASFFKFAREKKKDHSPRGEAGKGLVTKAGGAYFSKREPKRTLETTRNRILCSVRPVINRSYLPVDFEKTGTPAGWRMINPRWSCRF